MFRCYFLSIVLGLLVLGAYDGYGQKRTKDLLEEFPTIKVDIYGNSYKRMGFPDEQKIALIIKNNSRGILYGNPCAIEATRKMRFQYAIQNAGAPGSMGEFRRNWHNFKVKLRLVFTHSPFWKMTLKKRLRECGIKTGDRIG